MDLRHDVLAVDEDPLAAWRAERDVEDGAVLRHVDALPAEHGVDALPEARRLGQIEQPAHRLVGDAVLRVVEIESGGFERKALSAGGIVREQRPEMNGLQLTGMLVQS